MDGSREVVTRSHGDDSQGGTVAIVNSHEAVDHLVNDAISAKGDDRVHTARMGSDLYGIIHRARHLKVKACGCV